VGEDRLLEEAAVEPDEPQTLAAEFRERVLKEALGIVGGTGVAWAQPIVGHHVAVRDKGHQGMVRTAAALNGVVSLLRTLLQAITRDDARIHVQGKVVETQLPEVPTEQMVALPLIGRLAKLAKQPLVGITTCHTLPTENLAQGLILPGNLGVDEPVGPDQTLTMNDSTSSATSCPLLEPGLGRPMQDSKAALKPQWASVCRMRARPPQGLTSKSV
jgi:hypothetical protein